MKRLVVACGFIVSMCLLPVGGLVGATAAQDATPEPGCAVTSEDENEALVLRWIDAWDSGDPAAFEEVLADEYVHGWGQGQDTQDKDAFLARYAGYVEAMSNFDTTVTSTMTDGDLVAAVFTTSATHSGTLFGSEPTGEQVTWTGISVFRIECGEVVETWTEMDVFSILQQIGAPGVPATPVD